MPQAALLVIHATRGLDGWTLLTSVLQAPFRLPRIILFGTLFASSTLGLFIIISRLIKSLQGKVPFDAELALRNGTS